VRKVNLLVLGRERHLVDASTATIEENGFHATGVTRDDEAFALLDTGQFTAVVVGSGVELASRPPVKRHAAPHGTAVLEARRVPMQSVEEHLRDVIVPMLRRLG
jgi:hypothetical protein